MTDLFNGTCPLGKSLQLNYDYGLDSDTYSELKNTAQIKEYFDDHGYFIQRQIIDSETCDKILKAFKEEIKPSKKYIYRQASAKPEKNIFTNDGHLLNSILNPQSTDSRSFGQFRNAATELIASQALQKGMKIFMSESAKAVQSMFFDGNPVTWAHQDCYYLDAEKEGAMIGVWIALEDIHPGAGRFYIYPKSNHIDIKKNGGDFDIAFNHTRYKELVKDLIDKFNLKCHAPPMKKGDVLFWSSKTIHGSLEAFEPQHSRKSLTCHFIPESSKFIQFQKIEKKLKLKNHKGVNINFPKDLDGFKNRLIHKVETTFPKGFTFLKKLVIKLKVN